MKFTIDGYEVEVKAKFNLKGRYNKEDTMHLMNWLSMVLDAAACSYNYREHEALAKQAHKAADEIYYTLKDYGAYDKRG